MDNTAQSLTLVSPEAMACPFDTYDAMRAESPAYKDAFTGFYTVTRYADLRQVMGDPATFSSKLNLELLRTATAEEMTRMYEEAGFPPTDVVVSVDPPIHRRYRTQVDKVFSPKRVRDMEPAIWALIEKLVGAFPHGAFDFHEAFALPLPMRIIAGALGLPDGRMADFKRWSDASVDTVNQGRSPEQELAGARDIIEMRRFFCGEIAKARANPTDTLLSALANTPKEDGELMNDNELTLLLQVLLSAGNETTTHAIGSATYRLTQDLALQAKLRADPSLIPTFVEEVLRVDAPLQGLFRTATRDTEIGGVAIPKGAMVNVRFGAANRDPAQFACPAEIDLGRGSASHVTFGFGIHHCIGSQLARAELRLSMEQLLARSTVIRLADVPDARVSIPHFLTWGPRRLMIEFDRA